MRTPPEDQPSNVVFGQRLKALRQADTRRKEAICAAVGFSLNSLWMLERGYGCHSKYLPALAQFYGVSVDYLLGLPDAPTPGRARSKAEAAPTPAGDPVAGAHPRGRRGFTTAKPDPAVPPTG